MHRQTQPQLRRDARFLDAYRDESVRMHARHSVSASRMKAVYSRSRSAGSRNVGNGV